MRNVATGTLVIVALLSTACTFRALRHDQHVAAVEAEEFARRILIERNIPSAYEMVRAEDRQQLPLATLQDAVLKAHAGGYPTSVRATEFEPVLGQPAIQVFLVGETASEKFYYRVPMVGTVDSGYHPSGFYRGSGPYPPSQIRQSL